MSRSRTSEWQRSVLRKRHPIRVAIVPVIMLGVTFYIAFFLQQLVKFVAAKMMGMQQIAFAWGRSSGPLVDTQEWSGYQVGMGRDWWWAPQVIATGAPRQSAEQAVFFAAPAASLILLIILLFDLKRGKGMFSYIAIAANVLALFAAFAVGQLYRQ